jgi:hypothetical protein
MNERILTWQSAIDFGWLIFLLLLVLYFWKTRRFIQRSTEWVKTKGKITRCEWTTRGHRLWPKVEYLYNVGEQEYTGENMFIDTFHRTYNNFYARNVAYKIAQAFKNDQDVDVFYNPDDPDEAALDITVPGKLNLILMLLGILIIAHLVIVVFRVFF